MLINSLYIIKLLDVYHGCDWMSSSTCTTRWSSVETVTGGSTARRSRLQMLQDCVRPGSTVNPASTGPVQIMQRPTAPTHLLALC